MLGSASLAMVVMLISFATSRNTPNAVTRDVVKQRPAVIVHVTAGVVKVRFRVGVSIVRIVVGATRLLTCGPRGGSKPLDPLQLLEEVCSNLVVPCGFGLHVDIAQVIFGASCFISNMQGTTVSARCARRGGLIIA